MKGIIDPPLPITGVHEVLNYGPDAPSVED
jgi:hypothetical protein